jgi:frataxin-like iron-binding protein CyaY
MFHTQKIEYKKLNSRQQENYNFHKLAAVLADYGYTSIRLSDDWQSADCIAVHRDGSSLKIQLKGRFVLNKNYTGKDLWIAFPSKEHSGWYLYPHDQLIMDLEKDKKSFRFIDWFKKVGAYHQGILSNALSIEMQKYKL